MKPSYVVPYNFIPYRPKSLIWGIAKGILISLGLTFVMTAPILLVIIVAASVFDSTPSEVDQAPIQHFQIDKSNIIKIEGKVKRCYYYFSDTVKIDGKTGFYDVTIYFEGISHKRFIGYSNNRIEINSGDYCVLNYYTIKNKNSIQQGLIKSFKKYDPIDDSIVSPVIEKE